MAGDLRLRSCAVALGAAGRHILLVAQAAAITGRAGRSSTSVSTVGWVAAGGWLSLEIRRGAGRLQCCRGADVQQGVCGSTGCVAWG